MDSHKRIVTHVVVSLEVALISNTLKFVDVYFQTKGNVDVTKDTINFLNVAYRLFTNKDCVVNVKRYGTTDSHLKNFTLSKIILLHVDLIATLSLSIYNENERR